MIPQDIVITMTMNEEISVPFTVAYLNEYSGLEIPNDNVTFSDGDNANLGLEFELIDATRWAMKITKRQDYENVENRRYMIDIGLGSVWITLVFVIRNIFDNKPIVDILENPCSVNVSQPIDYFNLVIQYN
jgi:hypothetical protein